MPKSTDNLSTPDSIVLWRRSKCDAGVDHSDRDAFPVIDALSALFAALKFLSIVDPQPKTHLVVGKMQRPSEPQPSDYIQVRFIHSTV